MRFLLAAVTIGLALPAFAQPVIQEVVPENSIELSVGESRSYRFAEPIREAKVVSEGIVEVRPQNDRLLSFTGTKAGVTQAFVYDPQGKEIYRATIIVGQEPGNIVRLYDGRSKDYTGYFCTETACGRADKELNGARDLTSVTTVLPGGAAQTRTFGTGGQSK